QVTFTATVSPTDNGGTVTFNDNGTAINGCQALALSGGQATCQQTYDSGITHPITATYSGDGNFTGSTSPVLNQVVNAPVPDTLTLTSSVANVIIGQQVTFTATVSPTDSGGTITIMGLEDSNAGCAN